MRKLQQRLKRKANVDFDAYEKLIPEVKAHRKNRLVDLPTFFKNG
jgi:hypothetical protein